MRSCDARLRLADNVAKTTLKAALVISLLAACEGERRGGIGPEVGAPVIMAIFSQAHASGSLEYWGSCDIGRRPDFPKTRTNLRSGLPVEVLQDVFADDPYMRVEKEAGGMIRMVETDVPQDLLRVKIKRVSFAPNPEFPWELKNARKGGIDGLYDPDDALRHILSAPEVVGFRRSHDIGPFDFEQLPGGHEGVAVNPPRILGELSDVTMSEALDKILAVFPGIWIYESCPSKRNAREVFFRFYGNGPEWESLRKPNMPAR